MPNAELAAKAHRTARKQRTATTAPRGVRGSAPERNTGTAPGSRFPRAGGRNAVDLLSAYLNPGHQAAVVRLVLADTERQ